MTKSTENPGRRAMLQAWLAMTAAGAMGGCPAWAGVRETLAPTPACGPGEPATRASTEGPFYSRQPPLKSDFRADARGDPVTLVGFVLGADCRPIASATVDLWHADAQGEYDNRGYRLRGYQETDAHGRYVFETIAPGMYGRRTPHFHVKVRRPGGRVLTTQLYFPGEPRNERDSLFDARLLMDVRQAADGRLARFDFVLA